MGMWEGAPTPILKEFKRVMQEYKQATQQAMRDQQGEAAQDRTATEARRDNEIQGGTEAGLGGEGRNGTRNGTQEAGGSGKGKETARTGQVRKGKWRKGDEGTNRSIRNQNRVRQIQRKKLRVDLPGRALVHLSFPLSMFASLSSMDQKCVEDFDEFVFCRWSTREGLFCDCLLWYPARVGRPESSMQETEHCKRTRAELFTSSSKPYSSLHCSQV